MENASRGKTLWKTMKQRLGFNAISICGSSWSLQTSDNNDQISAPLRRRTGLRQISEGNTVEGMNLATALAAERGRNGPEEETIGQNVGKPFRSLLGQLQGSAAAAAGNDPTRKRRGIGEEIEGFDSMCCVCMERKKDAAFIPCGHTYCRVCSRELWLNRGCCPLCNCSITDVLDIF
ncbi:uncharacterized protein LOC124916823 [Impatiens glandulifera]|uniref:uncharacterized protein LOC124916823 n=1 Tax=Impatiens glandulifera TaxID=253017 RepID=UPI001FB1454E|nr:uncharacterized protein LOC124916823 [Impatiens glandulifera]